MYPFSTNSGATVILRGQSHENTFWVKDKNANNPLPDDKILDRSNLKHSADDNFKFDENSRKFSKRVENTVGKEEIAHHEQFLLFPQCFQKACFLEASKGVIIWEWDNQHFLQSPKKFSVLSECTEIKLSA